MNGFEGVGEAENRIYYIYEHESISIIRNYEKYQKMQIILTFLKLRETIDSLDLIVF